MKNYDMFVLADQLAQNLERLKSLKGAKFTYGILKNIDTLEKEVKFIAETAKPTEEFNTYEKARITLCETHAKKDDKGEILKKEVPGTGQFEYDIDTTSKEWVDAIDVMKETYKEVIANRDEQLKQYNELLSADCEIVFTLIKLDDVPNEISMDLMKIIKPFIKE